MAQVSRLTGLAVALVLGLPALVACSDDPPAASPPPTAASAPSPTASTTPPATPSGPPTLPAAARGTTPAAAKAFVRYYVSLINYGLETLDSAPLGARSSQSCAFCDGIEKALTRMKRAEGTYSGGRWHLLKMGAVARDGGIDVASRIRIERQVIKQRRPPDTARTPQREGVVSFFVIEEGAALKMDKILADVR